MNVTYTLKQDALGLKAGSVVRITQETASKLDALAEIDEITLDIQQSLEDMSRTEDGGFRSYETFLTSADPDPEETEQKNP